MRIGIISPVWFAVPPPGYGGIELVVSLLADGLVEAGHDVTLFASGDSHTKATLEWVFRTAPSAKIGVTEYEFRHALRAYSHAAEFEVLNDHSGPYTATLAAADGLGMLLHQAVRGFELWFQVRPRVSAELRKLVETDLEK